MRRKTIDMQGNIKRTPLDSSTPSLRVDSSSSWITVDPDLSSRPIVLVLRPFRGALEAITLCLCLHRQGCSRGEYEKVGSHTKQKNVEREPRDVDYGRVCKRDRKIHHIQHQTLTFSSAVGLDQEEVEEGVH